MRISDNISYYDAERMENQGLISCVQSGNGQKENTLFLTEKAHALKGEHDSVSSDEMGSIYYKGFSEWKKLPGLRECLADRIRKES